VPAVASAPVSVKTALAASVASKVLTGGCVTGVAGCPNGQGHALRGLEHGRMGEGRRACACGKTAAALPCCRQAYSIGRPQAKRGADRVGWGARLHNSARERERGRKGGRGRRTLHQRAAGCVWPSRAASCPIGRGHPWRWELKNLNNPSTETRRRSYHAAKSAELLKDLNIV
jgi:hypothetical protein